MIESLTELPDELPAVRYKVTYKDAGIYVVVTTFEGKPVEVFAEFSGLPDFKNSRMRSAWATITRLVTMCMRSRDIGLDKAIQQLERSSNNKSDIAGILIPILKAWQVPRDEMTE